MTLDPEPTLQDIARAAGKSVATVSRALRNHPGISKTTYEEVQRIASKMGYHPHPMLSALMTRLRYRRGIVLAWCRGAVTGLDTGNERVRFCNMAKALPFAAPPDEVAALGLVPFSDELNRELLVVKGLA